MGVRFILGGPNTMTLIINRPKMQSIWASVESYCLCRDFGYPQYLEVLTQHSKESPVSKETYAALGRVFFDEMTRSLGLMN